jgi:O-antigen/teichoic acid export membrane protein
VIKKARELYRDPLYRNSAYLTLTTVTMAVFGFGFWLLVAHLYRPEQVGIASTLISAMNFMAYASLLGVNSTFIRFLPKSKKRNEQINTGLILVTLATLIIAGTFTIIAPFYFAPKLNLLHSNLLYGIIFVILCIGNTINLVTDSIFISYRSTGYNLLVDGFIGSGTQLLLPLLLIAFGAFGIFAAQGTAAVVAMLASIYFLIRKFKYRPHLNISRVILGEIKRFSLFSYSSSMIEILPTIVIPIVILDKLGAAAAGYYYLASMMANVLFTVAYSGAESLFAEGAYAEKQLFKLIKRSASFMFAGLIPASILMALVGPLVIGVFGKDYSLHLRGTIVVLAASGPAVAGFAISNVILSITKRLKSLLTVNVIYSISICVLALLWVHKGLIWVAGAWLVSHVFASFVGFVFIGLKDRQHLINVRRRSA